MRKVIPLFIVCLMLLSASQASGSETYFKFRVDFPEDIQKLTRVISIDNVKDGIIYAYANDKQLHEFEKFGISYTILPHPSSLIEPEMSTTKEGLRDWDTYPTYEAYVDMMYQFAIDYPSICVVENIGYSVQGREILFAKISDNVSIEEDEPEVMHTATMHGNETAGYVLMLRLIDYFLTNYGTDSLVTRLIDSCEVWINPLANPDGTYHGGNHTVSGSTRNNANGVDLNRNFPDPEDGQHPDSHPWQAETVVMMDLAKAHSFTISANHHSGAEVVNYPWDTWYKRHADDAWYIDISREYADSAQYYSPSGYMIMLDNGITNGYDWYTIAGGRQDYMNYWHGCREVTLELSNTKLLPADQLPAHWNYNKASFINWLENGLYGIRGLVTEVSSGDPVAGLVRIIGHDDDSSEVRTDPDVGDYHRMIEAGTYNLEFEAVGYVSDTIYSVTVYDHQTVRVDIALERITEEPLLSFESHGIVGADPDDVIDFQITLANNSIGNAYDITGILSSEDSYITVTQASSAYPTILASGGTAISFDEYQFSIHPDCPTNYTAQFQLDVSDLSGYSDILYFNVFIGALVENYETGDFSSMPWQMSGNQPWTITSVGTYEGSYCARSGSISHYQNTQMIVTVDVIEGGMISFYYKVSSEGGWDLLKFYINNDEMDTWSGEAGWAQASYSVSSGTNTFKWQYNKDGNTSDGSDCAWIDLIVFPPIAPPIDITTEDVPDWTEGSPYSYQLEATGGIGTLNWADKNNSLPGIGLSISATGLLSGTPTSSGDFNFTAQVTDEGSGLCEKLFQFRIRPPVEIITESLPDGVQGENYSQQLAVGGGTGTKIWSDKFDNLNGTGLTLTGEGLLSGIPSSTGMVSFTAHVEDITGSSDEKLFELNIGGDAICGDVNIDGSIDILDILYLIEYKYKEGPEPENMSICDVNGDTEVDLLDILHLIEYKYKEGPEPNCL